MMTTAERATDFFDVSLRFYRALQAKALSLEAQAQKDEGVAAALKDAGHRERHHGLVLAQREDAKRLRRFLSQTRIRLK